MTTRAMRNRADRESASDELVFPLVVPEAEIRDYVENLGINDVCAAAARFQVVSDLTRPANDQVDLQRIRRVAGEDNDPEYRRIMEAILAAAGKGPRGRDAAHLTAGVAVQLMFRWSPEYFTALNEYKDRLRSRKLRMIDRDSSRRTSRRSDLRVANG